MKKSQKKTKIRGKYTSRKTGRSETYDSSYELRRFCALDRSPLVKDWTKDHHGLIIPYRQRGRGRKYFPDILVEYHDGRKFLDEVKGKVWDGEQFILKNLNAQGYCAMHGMKFRVIYRDDLDRVE